MTETRRLLDELADLQERLDRVSSELAELKDPIYAIKLAMQRRRMSNVDLYEIFGSKARVSEVMRRKRPLQVKHIRELHRLLGIPYETLVAEYALHNQTEGE